MTRAIIVIPCHNEFHRLQVDAFKDYALRGEPHQFLFVDDGSTDSTGELLQDLHAFDRNSFQVLRLARNCGKAEAVRHGFLAALKEQPEYVGYWDADLATPLDAIPEFCHALDESPGLEIVMGARVILLGHEIDRQMIRHYLGRLAAILASFAIGIRVYDAMCGAKCFRVTPRTASLFARPFRSRWVFDAEWLASFVNECHWQTRESTNLALCEVPLRQWREVPGSKLRWRDFFTAAVDLARIFLRYRCRWSQSTATGHSLPAYSFKTNEPVGDAGDSARDNVGSATAEQNRISMPDAKS